jgi:hypothetical protein
VISSKRAYVHPTQTASRALAITVLFTSVRPTLAALRRAAALAGGLGATIRILQVRTVPYPLPLNCPPTDREVLARNLSALVEGHSFPIRLEICYGRDSADSLFQSLDPRSIVVIGFKRTWWLSKEQRLAKQLGRRGHHVILAPDGES